MNRFSLALILLAVAGRNVYAEDKAEAIPVAPPRALPVVAVPQAAPLFRAPTDDLPTFVGTYGAPAPTAVGAEVPNPVQQVAAQSPMSPKIALLRQKQAELSELQEEVRRLRAETRTSRQIVVQVQMLEFSLTKMQEMGVSFPRVASGYFRANELSRMLVTTGPNGPQPFVPPTTKPGANEATRVVDWILDNMVGKILTDPNIVVVDGRPAQFNVGGEIPLPAKDGAKGIEYQPFGTQVDVVATSLGDNQVSLQLRTRVSEVDRGNSVEINGGKYPGLNVRQIDTEIESEFGQPTVLTRTTKQVTETIKTTSGLGEVANRVRGKATTREVTNEICLMLVVTPDRVDPVATPQPAAPNMPK